MVVCDRLFARSNAPDPLIEKPLGTSLRGRDVDAHLEATALDGRGAVGRLGQELRRRGGLHDSGVVAAAACRTR